MTDEAPQVLSARSIITMDPARPRAEAVAVRAGRIVAVGSLDDAMAAAPGASRVDLGDAVIMPGFVEAHSHPVLMGSTLSPPAIDIRPFVVPTWAEVERLLHERAASAPPGVPLLFYGLDPLLHRCATLDAASLHAIFGDRVVAVVNNSGHSAYVTGAALALAGITRDTPDPPGAEIGRGPDGSPDGVLYETGAMLAVAGPVLARLAVDPVAQVAQQYAVLARAGITSTSEMAFAGAQWPLLERLARGGHCPLRLAVYHMSLEPDAGEPLVSTVDPRLLRKQGVKLWADGSPWVGNIAISFEYLDTDAVRRAGITPHSHGSMNHGRDELLEVVRAHAPRGWQLSFHVHGDVAVDVVLDVYEQGLRESGRLGSDHRWRLEHCGAMTGEQLRRAASLGVTVSLFVQHLHYWGDALVDGLFGPEHGGEWMRTRDAFAAGLRPSFHNDGNVTPPSPLGSVQSAVTRRARGSGRVLGPDQRVTLEQALQAITVNGAWQLHADADTGSIEVGKLADLTELSADPAEVPADELTDRVQVLGTWLAGRRVDLDAFTAGG